MVLEIDPPEDPVSRRRKGFYEGLGLVSNPWPHIHPPYRLEFSAASVWDYGQDWRWPGTWRMDHLRPRHLLRAVCHDRLVQISGKAPVLSLVPAAGEGHHLQGVKAVELFQLLLEKGVQHASEQVGPAGSPEIWGLRGKGSFDIVLIELR